MNHDNPWSSRPIKLPDWCSNAIEQEVRGAQIAVEHRVDEAGLFHTKWIAYKGMHPSVATVLWAQYYARQVHDFIVRCHDAREAEQIAARQPEDPFDHPGGATSYWLARQCMDKVGIPYPVGLAYAERRFIERQYQRFPLPNQLYGEEFEWDLTAYWKERRGQILDYSQDPAVQSDPEHVQWVLDAVGARVPGARPGILGRMLREQVLTEAVIAERFGQAILDEARKHCARLVSQH